MTKNEVADRVRHWQRILAPLGVGHWTWMVEVGFAEPLDFRRFGSHATSSASDDYDSVEFWFDAARIDEEGPEVLDRSIIHEWLHCAFRDYDTVTERVEKWMPDAVHEEWEAQREHEQEGLIERIALLVQAHASVS